MPPPPSNPGWSQPWGGGNGNAPTHIPTQRQEPAGKRRHPVLLGCLAVVLTIVVGGGVWNAVSKIAANGGGYSNSGSGDSGTEKGASEPKSCGKLLNGGACTSDASKDSSTDSSGQGSNSGSGKATSGSEDNGDSEDSGNKVAPFGTLPYPLEGVWEGDVSQPAGKLTEWTVRLDLKGGKKRPGTMELVELGCVSKVTVQNAGTTTARLRAPVLNKNDPNGACAPLGQVILVQDASDPDKLQFTWQDVNNAGNVAIGEVERVE